MAGSGGGSAGKQYRLEEVQRDVKEVQGVMQQNIGKVLDNMETAESLQTKTEALARNANDFKKQSTGLKRIMCTRNAKLTMVIVGIIVGIIVVIIIVIVAATAGRAPPARPASGGDEDGYEIW